MANNTVNNRLILITILLTTIFSVPVLAQAQKVQSGLVPCGNKVDAQGKIEAGQECTFEDLIVLAQNVIDFLIFYIAAPLATLMFAYAGFLMFTNNGNEAQVTKAKGIFWSVLWGLIIALAAWLMISFILDFFGVQPGDNTRLI
jgi:hypothetical protein